MLADQFRRSTERTSRILADPGFRRNRESLVDAMKRSLDLRGSGESLLYLQGELANSVIHAHTELHKVKRGERKFDSPEDEERFVDVSKALVHVLRAIADGIAWRALAFDRAAIHEFALPQDSGHMEKATVLQEVTEAATILGEDLDQVVILNDLTNFLRYGDLTIVKRDSVWIKEVKAGKGAAKSGGAKHQKQRLRRVLEVVNGSDQLGSASRKLLRVKAKPASYQDDAYRTINLARTKGYASSRLSDAAAISVFDIDAVVELGLTPDDVLSNPFSGARYLHPFDSAHLVGLFTPNVAPYSVFQLPPEDRVDLMMGKLAVVTWLDLERLMAVARKRGLSANLPAKEDYERLPTNLKPGQVREHELDVAIGFGNGTHSLLLPISVLSRVGYEFLTEESFLDAVEECLEQAGSAEETIYLAFKEEHWLWD